METYTKAQFDRLPKWAQNLVTSAESQLAYGRRLTNEASEFERATKETAAYAVLNGPGEPDAYEWRGPVVAVRDPYDDQVPVARERDTIRFYFDATDHHKWVDVRVRNDRVEITADSMLLIQARSGNAFNVYTEGR